MEATKRILNELLVDTFNSILKVEQNAMRNKVTSDISITEIHTLDAIGIGEASPMTTVASRLEVTVATLTSAVNKLVAKGYVERERSLSDRRQVLIRLTSKGRTAYRVHLHFHNLMIEEAIEGLTQEEENILASSLSHVKTFFEQKALSPELLNTPTITEEGN